MSNLIAARVQMGNSLAFHIVFVVLAIGMPLLLCIAEGLGLWHKDPDWMLLARRWSKAVLLIFIIGAVSGTVISFELGLLWPTYINYTGAIVGPLFAIEGIFFFVEAIFLGIYLYGWDRLSARAHWICSVSDLDLRHFRCLRYRHGQLLDEYPTGFEIQNGKLTGINTWAAIFNPSQPYEIMHMVLAAFVGIGFGVATVYAIAILRGKHGAYYRKAMLLGLTVGLVSIPLQMFAGDAIARSLETQQPIKLASMEAVYNTSEDVPLHLMGIPNVPQEGWFTQGLVIPDGLSFLVGFSANTQVIGLNTVAASDRPSDAEIVIIHVAFDLMVLFGTFMLLVAAVFWILFIARRGRMPEYGWLLWAIIVCGPMGFLAVIFGWMVTEIGRQPWVIYNFLLTSAAVTPAPYMNITFTIFTLLYIVMAVILVVLLVRLARVPMPKRDWEVVTRNQPGGRIGRGLPGTLKKGWY